MVLGVGVSFFSPSLSMPARHNPPCQARSPPELPYQGARWLGGRVPERSQARGPTRTRALIGYRRATEAVKWVSAVLREGVQGEGGWPTAQDLRRAHKPRRVLRKVKRVLIWGAHTLTAMPIVVDPSTPVAFVVPDAAADIVDGVVRIDLGAAVSGVTTNDTENLSTLTPSPGSLTDALDGADTRITSAQDDATSAIADAATAQAAAEAAQADATTALADAGAAQADATQALTNAATAQGAADDAQADATAALGALSTLDTSGVGNASTVTGATATLALDDLNARIAALEALIAALPNMQSVFQDPIAVSTSPVLQIDGIYGLLDTDVATFTESGGTTTVVGNLFSASTSVSAGSYSVIRSARQLRYQAGQGIRARFTTAFPTVGVAQSLQLAGLFNVLDGLFVGYSGTSFGIMRRIAGGLEVQRLTVIAGSGAGSENVTITLNSVPTVIATGAGPLTAAALAQKIASFTTYTGWVGPTSPQSNGTQVTFVQRVPATAGGTYTMASTGTGAGVFTRISTGAPNDSVTGFVAQASWNLDPLDGSGPSGYTLVPSALNAWQIEFGYLGIAGIKFSWLSPDNVWIPVHMFSLANVSTATNQLNPTYRVGWIAASEGSTTALTVRGGSGAGFVDGEVAAVRDPFSFTDALFTASTTEYVSLAIRSASMLGSVINLRDVLLKTISVTCTEASSRTVRVRVVIGGTFSGAQDWTSWSSGVSVIEYVNPTTTTLSGGRQVLSFAVVSNQSGPPYDVSDSNVRLEPGETLSILLQTVASTAVCVTNLSWMER